MTSYIPTYSPGSLEQALHQAAALHQAGRILEAEHLYRAILEICPEHPETNHNMGVLAVQARQPAAGLPYFMAALDTDPACEQYWLSYIDALLQTDQLEDARQMLEFAMQQGLQGDGVAALAARLKVSSGAKPARQAKLSQKTVSRDGNAPSAQEIDALVTLFTENRHTEAMNLARTMTVRFPLHPVGWKMLGVLYKQMGQNADALEPMQKAAALSPNDAEAHNNLGITLNDLGYLSDAEASYRCALRINPDYAQAYSNLGATLHGLNRLREAEACYRRALQIHPGYARAHSNLGATLHELGRLAEAEASYRCALQIQPNYAEAYYNLANTLKDMGRLDEAEAAYRRTLQIKPDYVEAHSNLGAALQDMYLFDEAEASFRRALQIQPDFVGAYNHLAMLYHAQGESMMALNAIKLSLRIKETGDAKSIFVACVKGMHLTQNDDEIRATLVRALTEPWGRPDELARISIAFIKLDPEIERCMIQAADDAPTQFRSDELVALAADPLLCALLNSAPACDVGLERLLTRGRRAMLEAAMAALDSGSAADVPAIFCCALARQCFINEYVFSCSDNEIRKAEDLRDLLLAALAAKKQIPVICLATVAAYFPLCSLPLAARLLERTWPEEVATVLVQQVHEPAEELQLRTMIPRLTEIVDEVSLRVQNQYEENPYPRWIKTAPPGEAKNINVYLSQKFPFASLRPLARNDHIDVLIGGCGTGQHPIDTAQRICGAKVLAVDLSLSSLAYAKRKTRELGLTSIEYAQADILKLSSLGRSFDMIASSGVLHHLADPWTGWRVLLSLLRPGGFMKLGFYSEAARRNIVRIRNLIAARGYGATVNEIRRCRQALMNMDTDFGAILESPDFFSISACRDLLFHVQEHRLTLTAIDAFIGMNDLKFMGFELEQSTLHAYKRRFPNDGAATNLGQWQVFENENPDTFAGMYQFWVQNER